MSPRPYLLGAVALALAGGVVWDYWPADPGTPQTRSPAQSKPAVIGTLNPMSQRPQADFAALFDHPLFDPTRTKAAPLALPVAAPAPETAATPIPTAIGPAQPVLMGTVTSPWPGGVYLGDDQGGPVVFLRPGEEAHGLHLEEARASSARFMGPEGEVTLTLHKANPAAPVMGAQEGNASAIPAPDPTASDPNAPDLGAMAPGAIDPTATDPSATDPAATDPSVPATTQPDAPVPTMPLAIAPKMPLAP